NDIWGLRRPGAVEAVRESRCGVCVMHMLGEPQTMQRGEPEYGEVVDDVRAFLQARVDALMAAGVAKARICVDPGFGFGKATVEHNYALLARLGETVPRAGEGAAPFPLL